MKKQKLQRLMSFLLVLCILTGLIPSFNISAKAADISMPGTVEIVTTEELLAKIQEAPK